MNRALVLQSDFGLCDGAVNAMKGVAFSVNPSLQQFDLTHDIPPYNIWEASYRIWQTISYWPEETVFVSVVDPGVGSNRNSVVVKTSNNRYIVTPDNGTLTHIYHHVGVKEVRLIDEEINRLPQSGASHTFHGRDVYAFTGARLAAGVIRFQEVGPVLSVDSIVTLPFQKVTMNDGILSGIIDILDVRFGNLWTNIEREVFLQLDVDYGDILAVTITNDTKTIYTGEMVYGRSFAAIDVGQPLLYINSLDNVAVALNQQSFANTYHIQTGSTWQITIKKIGT